MVELFEEQLSEMVKRCYFTRAQGQELCRELRINWTVAWEKLWSVQDIFVLHSPLEGVLLIVDANVNDVQKYVDGVS